MAEWVDFYERLFNFREIRYFDIEGQVTGVKSKAPTSPCGKIRIPINEEGNQTAGQITEYLERYRGEGIQHITMGSGDLPGTADALRASDLKLLDTIDTYYELLDKRIPGHGEDVAALKARKILLDGKPGELLLQIFSENQLGPIFFEFIQRKGDLWSAQMDHSPMDVIAWHGNYAPDKYDLRRFNAIGSISYDHPDPSIFLVLHSPSDTPGVSMIDLVIFPPRILAMQDTFRPPWFHRNIASEFMGLIHGTYDAKAEGFLPGGASLHNNMSGHGPDAATFEKASRADLSKPDVIRDTWQSHLVPQSAVKMGLPCHIGDYTDFYTSLHHATTVGRQFRPDTPLLPNYKWVPIGYHGRASSIGVSGQSFHRPHGQTRTAEAEKPDFGPCRRLDFELELGAFIAAPNPLGQPVSIAEAEERVFGFALFNDWSARDIQAWECQRPAPSTSNWKPG